ncbi:MAG: hypothetical protein HY049_15600 [Acidobacteria bacterium]|nr:hypothetical protein [Acidobacteriota bacterium]
MTATRALTFVRKHGVVLMSARGPVPSLVEAVAGEPIKGSWWSHPDAHRIYGIVESVCDSKDVMLCRLVSGKVTLVHRRVWPALVRLAERWPKSALAAERQEHTERGSHRVVSTPYPKWVPEKVAAEAKRMSEPEAIKLIGEACLPPARR